MQILEAQLNGKDSVKDGTAAATAARERLTLAQVSYRVHLDD